MIQIYEKMIYPKWMTATLSNRNIIQLRENVVQNAYGSILEIGIGAGTNLELYPSTINKITAIDNYILHVKDSRVKVNFLKESVCDMHFPDETFDTVVSTFCLCSVDDTKQAYAEIYRVLKPGGQLLFLEHGRARCKVLRWLQNLFNPVYQVMAFGCNINRDHIGNMKKAGFKIKRLQITRAHISPRVLTGYAYLGIAVKPRKEK